jgi:hypothetical protein
VTPGKRAPPVENHFHIKNLLEPAIIGQMMVDPTMNMTKCAGKGESSSKVL